MVLKLIHINEEQVNALSESKLDEEGNLQSPDQYQHFSADDWVNSFNSLSNIVLITKDSPLQKYVLKLRDAKFSLLKL